MGKSKNKTPAIKAGGIKQSDKVSKRIANRKFRRRSRQIKNIEEQLLPKKVREVQDNWNFNSDGLAIYWKDLPEKYLRK